MDIEEAEEICGMIIAEAVVAVKAVVVVAAVVGREILIGILEGASSVMTTMAVAAVAVDRGSSVMTIMRGETEQEAIPMKMKKGGRQKV
mmetsp:Transcript_31747/g.47992  ORF Transcript_31747/g.47992 Transcript_31747/m.47992 type:complete len:89 (+) Transcript_31747:530-796(+)